MAVRRHKARRSRLIAAVHLGAKRLGFTEDERRLWLERSTGKRSCSDLGDETLEQVVKALNDLGALDPPGSRGGTSSENRPTPAQWSKLAALARELGFNGLSDNGLKTFVKRICKVESPRFLTRSQISDAIVAAQRWRDHRRSKESGSHHATRKDKTS